MITSFLDLTKGFFIGLTIGIIALFIIVKFNLLPIGSFVCP